MSEFPCFFTQEFVALDPRPGLSDRPSALTLLIERRQKPGLQKALRGRSATALRTGEALSERVRRAGLFSRRSTPAPVASGERSGEIATGPDRAAT